MDVLTVPNKRHRIHSRYRLPPGCSYRKAIRHRFSDCLGQSVQIAVQCKCPDVAILRDGRLLEHQIHAGKPGIVLPLNEAKKMIFYQIFFFPNPIQLK